MEKESMERHPDASFNFRKQEMNIIFKPQI